jgi:Ca2+-binding EF-hand superfamily protein
MKMLMAGVALAGLIATALPAQGMPEGPRPGWGEHMRPPTTRAEVEARVAEHFAKFDADHDGIVTRTEFDTFLARRRVEWEAKRKEHRDHAFDRLDKNHDGKLSRAEFASPPPPGEHGERQGPDHERGGSGSWRPHRPHPGMMAAHWFERLDVDHDGRVTLAEAKAAALARFDRLDTNHDGTLSPDELRAGWAMHRPGGPEGPRGPGGPGGRRGDMPPPPPPPPETGPRRGPGYDLPAGTPPAPAPAPQTT